MQQTSNAKRAFAGRLDEWREALGDGHNAFARRLGISGPYWHQIRTGERFPKDKLIERWIALATEPWHSALIAARQADQAAGVAAAMAAVA